MQRLPTGIDVSTIDEPAKSAVVGRTARLVTVFLASDPALQLEMLHKLAVLSPTTATALFVGTMAELGHPAVEWGRRCGRAIGGLALEDVVTCAMSDAEWAEIERNILLV